MFIIFLVSIWYEKLDKVNTKIIQWKWLKYKLKHQNQFSVTLEGFVLCEKTWLKLCKKFVLLGDLSLENVDEGETLLWKESVDAVFFKAPVRTRFYFSWEIHNSRTVFLCFLSKIYCYLFIVWVYSFNLAYFLCLRTSN